MRAVRMVAGVFILLIALEPFAVAYLTPSNVVVQAKTSVSRTYRTARFPRRLSMSRVEFPARTWDSPKTWRWGYGIGDAHDCAYQARSALRTEDQRTQWLQDFLSMKDATQKDYVSWEEAKLVFALVVQRCGHEGGGEYRDVADNLARATYEQGGLDNFIDALEERFPLIEDRCGRFSDLDSRELADVVDVEERRRWIMSKVLVGLEFLSNGA